MTWLSPCEYYRYISAHAKSNTLRTRLKLNAYKRHDCRKNDLGRNDLNTPEPRLFHSTPSTTATTPTWDPSSQLSPSWSQPAWASSLTLPDFSIPQSPLNQSQPDLDSDLCEGSSRQTPPVHQHVLLNQALGNVKLKVIVNGGIYSQKELIVSVSEENNQLTIVYTKHTTSHNLNPEWVTPKHPSATHDNGLLVVIEGDHVGKLVKRIHHRHGPLGSVMILAVLEGGSGKECLKVGHERLELRTDHLCCVQETKEEKESTMSAMQLLRKNHPKSAK